MNYKLDFIQDKYNSLILEYDLSELLNIPDTLATLSKTKDNDLLLVNTIKSSILPHLPRDLTDYKREKLLELLKEVHDLSFNIIDSNDHITYKGNSIITEENNEIDVPTLKIEDLNLVELLNSKQDLEIKLQTVNLELDKQLTSAWIIINEKLNQLNEIKSKWEELSASHLDSDAINTIYTASLTN